MTDATETPATGEAEAADAPASKAERQAQKLIRRQKRNLRKAGAEGFLRGVCAMLKPGDLALDCGANMGVVTAQLAATGADVVAYEPDPFAFARLAERFADTPNVTLVNAAVAARAGTVTLMRAENFDANPEGASVKSTILDGGRAIDARNGIEVPCLDFLEILRRESAARGPVAFVKMDIEGAELEILEAMVGGDLSAGVRCLVAETHERKFRDLRDRFRALRKTVSEDPRLGHINLDWI
ncbi:FkbM family methyltransferase [Oceaniglobus roseus]|uniref:FkbM family methyltransferase n=1 Tax=Oceaniglobus roseus TaxID=1737570 RepID=UPI000C7F32D4|nr:FkbM family methyltransferase [Kandeliimicrobium roseum]